MPGTPHELVTVAGRIDRGELTPDDAAEWPWADGTVCGCEEWHDLMALVGYLARQRRAKVRHRHQRRACRLLHSLLSAEQRRSLRASKGFLVVGSQGGTYRLIPCCGRTELVIRHGSRWYVRESYCFHDDRTDLDEAMPDADISIAHMLLIIVDEGEFLARANATTGRDQIWNGDYLRRMREVRRQRSIA
jgi:hypothetical protein